MYMRAYMFDMSMHVTKDTTPCRKLENPSNRLQILWYNTYTHACVVFIVFMRCSKLVYTLQGLCWSLEALMIKTKLAWVVFRSYHKWKLSVDTANMLQD